MAVYLIADITVHDPELYQDYVRQVPVFIEKYQGRYIVRGGNVETREGDWHPQRLIVLEFPDKEHATAFLDDPEYQAVAAIRHAAARTNLILAEKYEE